jgi:hypothetical protein
LERIYPVNESTVQPYIGKYVCLVLCDGSQFVGTISSIGNGGIYLSPYISAGNVAAVSNINAVEKQVKKTLKNVKVKAFTPFFNPFFFPFSSLAFLFTSPFLFSPFFF